MTVRITVTCEDGQVRHDGTFATMREAGTWAEWGHTCTTAHKFSSQPNDPAPLTEVERQTYPGSLAFVPLTAAQLEMLTQAVGTEAGRLADDPLAASDAYVPWATLQSYLGRFQQALAGPPPTNGLSCNEAERILRRILATQPHD